MKRFTVLLAIILMTTMPMMAERVTPEAARKVATTFLNNNGAKSDQLTDLTKSAGFSNLYIFTTENSFVVMSADDCMKPILGYSLTGKFVVENMPENVAWWLQNYDNEIQYAIENKMRATTEIIKSWKDLFENKDNAAKASVVVAPLIQTKWNQNKYYNNLCPEAVGGSDGHVYTGCVATAMAQIMKYYQYPSKGIGSHSYTWNGQNLSVDFSATTYDWDNMEDYYNYYFDDNGNYHSLSVPSNEQIAAVATLMYHCGVSVDMKYSAEGSGAYTGNVAVALKAYFNYDPDIEYREKSAYNSEEWANMIKTELNASRPLEYGGQDPDPNGGAGHAFVCDGYNSDDYFHFNWGWSGHYDGYFSLSNLDTGANSGESGAGNGVYTANQAAIFGIQPIQGDASTPTNLTYTLSEPRNITLNWEPANGATSYNVYRNNSYIGNTANVYYTEAAPWGNSVYYVRSVDSEGRLSLSSNTQNITIDYQTPVINHLGANLSDNNVSLNWAVPEWCFPQTESSILTYGNGIPETYSGYYGRNMYWGHRFLPSDLEGTSDKAIYRVSFYVREIGTYELNIYQGTTISDYPDGSSYDVPSTLMTNKTITAALPGWFIIDLDEPIAIDSSQDLWIIMYDPESKQLPASCCFFNEHDRGGYVSLNISNWTLSDVGYAFLIRTYVTDGTYTYDLYQDGVRIAEDLNETTYSNASLNSNAANLFTVKTNYYGGKTDDSNKIGFAKGTVSLSSLELDTNDMMTITESSSLTVSGTLSNDNSGHLILENDAQLINSSEGVKATVKKAIQPYTNGKNNGWNLIASPVTDSLDAEDDVDGLVEGTFDLYVFNQSGTDENDMAQEWRNYEAEAFDINHKTGYLYSNSNETTISFAGTLAGTARPTTITRDDDVDFKGFNLIGNPYPCNAYTNQPFYILQYNEEDDKTSFILGESPIPPCAAFLVQAQVAEDSVTFSKAPLAKQASITMKLSKPDMKSTRHIDQARISFEADCKLSKYTWDDVSSTIYIPQNGQNYAVAYANGQNEMPLNFEAAKNGTYALGFEVKDLELGYLHLIDNMTGADVDLLATPSYTFEGNTTDYASRFKLVFAPICEDADGDNEEPFAYFANEEIRLVETCHGASLQIVDMMGRVIWVGDAMNRVSTKRMSTGVYVLRLINGNDVKTQKIVIE